ncbi:MAG: NYN domain-containing protein [Candidatus Omnitrophota bacterium]|nr:NYN domain-containing protein [Candidatus Omnitrophota bacterium]MDZ4241477.1 NYN domain-containing protein [Candidatus Omnitrophota bacterium]
MALHYLLDGYNVIHKVPALVSAKLEDAREGLVRLVETHRPQGSVNNRVTVVFDGQPGIVGNVRGGEVAVVFSSGESADDRIKRIVDESGNKRSCVVVTDDRDVQYYVRSLGARVVGVAEFLSRMKPAGAAPQGGQPISKTEESRITSEMKDIWLKKRKGA